jgi:uncharacterized membrane protein YkvA (DUF1232 family)
MNRNTADDVKVGEILAPVDAAENRRRERDVRARFWRTAKRAARQVPFMDELVAAYYAAMDERTPARAKAMMLAALAYLVVPFDIVPDFLAVIGFGDDIAVLTAAIAAIRPHIKESHRAAAREALAEQ